MADSGIEVLYSDDENHPAVDIVFVHGLRGHRINTWQDNDVLWPRDLLPQDIKNARIMTWGYDSDVARIKNLASQNNIFGHSENLLGDVLNERRAMPDRDRPIIFVGHSLGGLVIKAALNRGHELAKTSTSLRDTRKGSVYECTHGVVFLGVPHQGSSKASLGLLLAAMAEAACLQPNKSLVNTLSQQSDILDQQRDSFSKVSQHMQLACIWEEIPMRGFTFTGDGIVVTKESAKIAGSNVIYASVPKNHREMCKFAGRDDVGYKRITGILYDMLDSVVEKQASRIKELETEILAQLAFDGMDRRFDDIEEAHQKTFEWIYDSDDLGFAHWLGNKDDLFWITGSPGSGKSTLMKFLKKDNRTMSLLRKSMPSPLLAGFFFHDHTGSPLLKTREGLLRAIIFQVLHNYRSLIPLAFPERWYALHSSSPTMRQKYTSASFSYYELNVALRAVSVQDEQKLNLCLLIDGLDEFDGDDEDIVNMITDLRAITAPKHQLKLCVSSRPLAVFDFAFSNCPHLQVHELTAEDIRRYARYHFAELEPFLDRLRVSEEQLEDLASQIQEQSQGVFLWVRIVLRELKQGARQYETHKELCIRLQSMPSNLSSLYEHLVYSIDPLHCPLAAKIFRLIKESSLLTPLAISLALEDDPRNIQMPLEDTDPNHLQQKSEDIISITKLRLNGLVRLTVLPSGFASLFFLHVTFNDHLDSVEMQMWLQKHAPLEEYDPRIALLRSRLLEIRHLQFEEGDLRSEVQRRSTGADGYSKLISDAMQLAAQVEFRTGTSLIEYIDALDNVCSHQYAKMRSQMGTKYLREAEIRWEKLAGRKKSWVSYLMSDGRGFHGWYAEPTDWQSDIVSWAARLGMKEFIDLRVRRGYSLLSKPGRPLLNYAVDPEGIERGGMNTQESAIEANLPLIKYLLDQGCDPNSAHTQCVLGDTNEGLSSFQILNKSWTPWQALVQGCEEKLAYNPLAKPGTAVTRRLTKVYAETIKDFILHDANIEVMIWMSGRNMGYYHCMEVIETLLNDYGRQDVQDMKDLLKARSKADTSRTSLRPQRRSRLLRPSEHPENTSNIRKKSVWRLFRTS